MSVVVPPFLDLSGRPSEDEVDGLLRTFYKAELPNPWPSLEATAAKNVILPFRPTAKRFPMLRTRLALAACVAFLVAGPLALSTYFNGGGNQDTAANTQPAGDPGRAEKTEHGGLPYHIKVNDNSTSIEIKIPYGREK